MRAVEPVGDPEHSRQHTDQVLIFGRQCSKRGMCLTRADASVRTQVIEAVQLFRAKVIDVSPDALTIEATGTRSKLDALLRMVEPYGIREIVQSGVVAVGRGPKSITATR